MNKETKTPKLRFDNFKKEYKQNKMNNIGEFYNGLSGKKKDDFNIESKNRFVTYMNVFTNPISKIEKIDTVYIKENEKQNKVNYGDIFFTQSSETVEEVGMSSVWLYNIDNIYLNSFCFGYRLIDIEKTSPLYMAYLLRTHNVRKEI